MVMASFASAFISSESYKSSLANANAMPASCGGAKSAIFRMASAAIDSLRGLPWGPFMRYNAHNELGISRGSHAQGASAADAIDVSSGASCNSRHATAQAVFPRSSGSNSWRLVMAAAAIDSSRGALQSLSPDIDHAR